MTRTHIGSKWFVVIALVLLLPAIAFARGEAEEVAEDQLNMVIGDWAVDVLEDFILEYGESRGIEIGMEGYPFDQLFETIEIRQQAEARDIDVIFVDGPVTANYAERGFILPLDDYFTRGEMEELWSDASIGAGSVDGRFFSAPLNNSSQVLYYNRDLLERAGVEFPSADIEDRWTWEQIVEAAQKVDALGDDIAGFQFDQVNRYYQLQPLPEGLGGGDGIGEDGLADLTNPGWIEAFQWYQNLYGEWGIARRGTSPAETPELFAAGRTGFFVGGLWNIRANFQDVEDLNYGVAPHPYFADGVPVTPTGSWHVGIWSHTRNPDAAADFVRWMTASIDIAEYWLEGHGQFPAHVDLLEKIQTDEQFAEQPLIAYRIAAYEAENTAVPRAATPGFFEFERGLNEAIEDIRNGVDVETALSDAEARINRALRRYQ